MRIFYTLFLVFSSFLSFSQVLLYPTVISSGGHYSKTDNYAVTGTIGELAVTTLQKSSNVLTQGFNQPDIHITPGISEVKTDWSVSAYPNPVQDIVNIKFSLVRATNFLVEIYDISGKKIYSDLIQDANDQYFQSIDVSMFERGMYILHIVSANQKTHKTFKINKL